MSDTKSMIIVEDRLQELFNYLPVMNGIDVDDTFAVTFKYGNIAELEAFLKSKKNETDPYPLIWLAYPYTEEHTKSKVKINNMTLILAVSSDATMLNDQRMKETFSKVLIPLFDNIKNVFKFGNIIDVGLSYEITKYPNYSNTTGDKHQVLAIWDALKITFDCTINKNCLKPIT